MDDRDTLIANQAIEIMKLKEKVNEYEERIRKINAILYGVGGPMNDRFPLYNVKVDTAFGEYNLLTPIAQIAQLVILEDDD